MRVHLDTDIGGDIDDLYALAYLARREGIELTGVTTVLDDGGRRAGYAAELLRLAGVEGVPIAEGAREAAARYRSQIFGLPDEATYWPAPVTPRPGDVGAALDLLASSIEAGATVMAIGPLTNLALLEERHTGILRNADLVFMGSFIRPIPAAYPAFKWTDDFNVQADPAAAEVVLGAVDPARVLLVPLEVTVQTFVRRRDLPRLAAAGALGALLARQGEVTLDDLEFDRLFGRRHDGLPEDLVNFMHDPLAVAAGCGWPYVTVEEIPIRLEWAGDEYLRTIEDAAGRAFRVVTAVDAHAFLAHWLEVVAP